MSTPIPIPTDAGDLSSLLPINTIFDHQRGNPVQAKIQHLVQHVRPDLAPIPIDGKKILVMGTEDDDYIIPLSPTEYHRLTDAIRLRRQEFLFNPDPNIAYPITNSKQIEEEDAILNVAHLGLLKWAEQVTDPISSETWKTVEQQVREIAADSSRPAFAQWWDHVAKQHQAVMVEKGFGNADKWRVATLMHSEISELVETWREGGTPVSRKIPPFTHETEELADLVLRVMMYGADHALPVGEAILAKLHYNKTRPKYHGKSGDEQELSQL